MKKRLKISKGVIRIRKSKVRQHNGQNEKDKRTKNDLQNIAHRGRTKTMRLWKRCQVIGLLLSLSLLLLQCLLFQIKWGLVSWTKLAIR
jgi:hypothetical protein